MRDNVTATECCDACDSTFVLKWKVDLPCIVIRFQLNSDRVSTLNCSDIEMIELFFFFAFQLLLEHRPPTILRHSARSCALLSASLQLSFMLPSSFSTVLFHVFFGFPLSRQPWGVHLRAFFVILLPAFLIVCPIQVHFLRVIVVSMESCSAMFHNSLLLMLSFQLMLKILRKQLPMKTWILHCSCSGDRRGSVLN